MAKRVRHALAWRSPATLFSKLGDRQTFLLPLFGRPPLPIATYLFRQVICLWAIAKLFLRPLLGRSPDILSPSTLRLPIHAKLFQGNLLLGDDPLLANIPIAIASCVLFASCTTHFVLEFVHFYVAMVRVPHMFSIPSINCENFALGSR